MTAVRRNTHFGAYGVDTPSSAPNHGKARFLRPLPHSGDSCPCQRCDEIRQENALARTSINWKPDYPPLFYSSVNWEEWRYE